MAQEGQGRQRTPTSVGSTSDEFWEDSVVRRNRHALFEDEDDLKTIADLKEGIRKGIQDNAEIQTDGWCIEDDLAEPSAVGMKTESVGYVPASSSSSSTSITSSARFRAGSQPTSSTKSADSRPATPTLARHGSPAPDRRTHKRASSSISDMVAATTREPTHAEIAKLQAQVNQLERKLQREQIGDVSVEQTIKRMLLGKPYLLEPYRSLTDKRRLLESAVNTHDGNIINAVLHFLSQTLTTTLFRQSVQEMGVASQYVNFLLDRQAVVDSCDMLASDGRSNEAAMRQYRYAMKTVDVTSRVRQIEAVFKQYFSNDPLLETDKPFVQNQLNLLRIQRAIQEADEQSNSTNPILRQYRPTKSLVSCPLLQTLFYSCYYHFDEDAGKFASPKYITANYQISDKQFQWVATRALANLKRWKQLEALFAGKNFFGKKTINSCIGFENVVSILHKTHAPPDIMNSYCALVTPSEQRLCIAQRYDCQMVIIDTLVASKDRGELENFARKVKPGTMEETKIRTVLNNSTIKWKN